MGSHRVGHDWSDLAAARQKVVILNGGWCSSNPQWGFPPHTNTLTLTGWDFSITYPLLEHCNWGDCKAFCIKAAMQNYTPRLCLTLRIKLRSLKVKSLKSGAVLPRPRSGKAEETITWDQALLWPHPPPHRTLCWALLTGPLPCLWLPPTYHVLPPTCPERWISCTMAGWYKALALQAWESMHSKRLEFRKVPPLI